MERCITERPEHFGPLFGYCDHQVQELLDRRLRQYDVSPMQCRTLTYLHEAKGEVNQKQMERHLMVKPSTVNGIVDRLEEKGMVTRTASRTDGRCRILALTAQLAEGESRLTHCGRLRLKECDRLAATVEILNLLGGDAKADGDDIVLHGVKQLRGGITLPNYGDHRMVMLASIAATKCEQPIEMDGIEAIDKSWPEYLKVYQMLGGKCE